MTRVPHGSPVRSSSSLEAVPGGQLSDASATRSFVDATNQTKTKTSDSEQKVSFVGDVSHQLSQASDLTGCTLDNRYQVLGLLGEGAMAKVYYVRELSTGELLAAKTLKFNDEELVARFAREVRIYEKLKHPNIVDARECLRIPGPTNLCFSIMELIEGTALESILSTRGAITDLKQFVAITSQLLEGLSYAHNMGIIHRDLKPDNIIVREDLPGSPLKILDFGLAKLEEDLQRLTKSGVVLGSPAYMSPEQCMGEGLDSRSDIYSLGILLFEMLTGKLPYEENAPVSMMQAHCDEGRLPLTLTAANLKTPSTLTLQYIITKMLAYSPSDRYSNINEVKMELHRWWLSSECYQEGIPSPFPFEEVVVQFDQPKDPDDDDDITIEDRLELDELLISQLRNQAKKAAEQTNEYKLPRRRFNPKSLMPLAIGVVALAIVSMAIFILSAIESTKKNSLDSAPKQQVLTKQTVKTAAPKITSEHPSVQVETRTPGLTNKKGKRRRILGPGRIR